MKNKKTYFVHFTGNMFESFCTFSSYCRKTEEFFNFSFVNGGRKNSWKEKFPYKSTFEMWKGTNGVLKFGEIFYHGVPESDINAMVFTHGKGRKFRVVIKKDTFPPKTQP